MIIKWQIGLHFGDLKVIYPCASHFMVEFLGNDLSKINNEIDKLTGLIQKMKHNARVN